MPGGCVINALLIEDGLGIAWSLDIRWVQDALRGWLAEQAKKGGVAWVKPPKEEVDKKEDYRRASSMASGVAPL